MARARIKRRIWVGATLGAVAIGTWWVWSTQLLRRTILEQPAEPEAFVQLTGRGGAANQRILNERATFFDPTPLFLPTAYNYGQGGLPRRLQRQPGQVFGNFSPKMNFEEGALPAYASETGAAPENLSELLSRANEAPFAGFGETGDALGAAEPRQALVEIKSLAGFSLSRHVLQGGALPRQEFAPLEFVVAVGATGVIAQPTLMASSGWEDIDAFFRDYLVKTYRVGERLSPGRYRILVGP